MILENKVVVVTGGAGLLGKVFVKEILISGKIGSLFKIGDYKKLASEIIKYNNNRKIYQNKINQAYNMLQRFDFEKNCKKYLSLIKKYI